MMGAGITDNRIVSDIKAGMMGSGVMDNRIVIDIKAGMMGAGVTDNRIVSDIKAGMIGSGVTDNRIVGDTKPCMMGSGVTDNLIVSDIKPGIISTGITDNLIINNIKIPLIGNDIIDLRTAAVESNWRRPNYLSKIFTPEEQSLIKDDKTVWWLWSAKESVYKIINRATLQRRYAPLSITWFSENIFKYEGEKFFIKSEITDEFIHTIAVANPELFPQLEVCKDPTIKYYKDENGMPMIDNQPVSISHHGRYWAMVKQKIFKAILPV